nr:MAG TPA: hypothetical protein [Caudoviricetes sp.]
MLRRDLLFRGTGEDEHGTVFWEGDATYTFYGTANLQPWAVVSKTVVQNQPVMTVAVGNPGPMIRIVAWIQNINDITMAAYQCNCSLNNDYFERIEADRFREKLMPT